MNQDLPMNVDPLEEKGTITYATEVISTIVGVATTEVEGIASMSGTASISELLSGKPKNLSRGVRVEVGAEEVAVDVSVIVDYGMPIQSVGRNVQENIRKSIETMTGLHVIKVDVHVMGVSFEKENKELEQSQEVARLQSHNSGGSNFGGILKEGAPKDGTSKDAASLKEGSAQPEKASGKHKAAKEEHKPETEPVASAESEPDIEAEAAQCEVTYVGSEESISAQDAEQPTAEDAELEEGSGELETTAEASAEKRGKKGKRGRPTKNANEQPRE